MTVWGLRKFSGSAAAAGLLAAALSGCASLSPEEPAATGAGPLSASASAPATPTYSTAGMPTDSRGRVRAYNRPYQVKGRWYIPAAQPEYDETGIASWYGYESGQTTANGEAFATDDALTCAHTTLPIPSLVEITNLENGRRIKARLNDRGPFVEGRLIDVSKAAARELGFLEQGTARVRVRYLGPAPLLPAGPVTVASRLGYRSQGPASSIFDDPAPAPVVLTAAEAPASAGVQTGDYAVQAGAFQSAETAEHAAAVLAQAGETEIRPVERDGGRLYRVMVGPWRDWQSAASALDRVSALGFSDAEIVRDR